MKPLERLLFNWRWRAHRVRLPTPHLRRRVQPYGYAAPRDGISPVVLAVIVVAAIGAGAWLGSKVATSTPAPSGADLLAAPSPEAQDGRLREVIAVLSRARTEGRNDLAAAPSASAQAAAAQGLRRANLRAVTRLDGSQKPVAAALRRTAAAYGALERAAESKDQARFARAATAVEAAERDLERLIGDRL